jgi:hypothetical protein
MNVRAPGNDAVPVQATKTKRAMGEIVDLDRYRKQRKRREAEAKRAKKASNGDRRDGVRSKDGTSPPAADRVESNRAGRDGAAKSGSDDPNPD